MVQNTQNYRVSGLCPLSEILKSRKERLENWICSRSWSSSCGRQSVDQFVWIWGLPLGPLTRFYLALLFSSDNYFILLPKESSLTRKRVCSLQCNHSLVRLLTPNNHTLPSHLRLCSLFVASYDSQGLRWKYSNSPSQGDLFQGLGLAICKGPIQQSRCLLNLN
jgi:hypothetical protein